MVEKTMNQQKICSHCGQRQTCQDVYRKLGNIKGPSVVLKVIIAFLLPLVIFIGTLTIFEEILKGKIASEPVQTILVFLLALSVSAIFISIIRTVNKRADKN
jgi:hypothetical protein